MLNVDNILRKREMEQENIQVDVTKRFGGFPVLEDIRFTVRHNEFLCIAGPSGCGKTTLLQTIAGITPVSSGQVLLNGEPIDLQKHNIAYVFQEPSCLPWKTVEEDVRVGFEFRNNGTNFDERVREVLKTVGLTGFEGYFPNQLSGGMKQRVAIARAFAAQPDLLLMDEPFGHLDAQTRYFMQIAVRKIWEAMKATVVFVTNDVEEAVYLGDRVLVLSSLPARIKVEVPIDIPQPRDLTGKEFLQIRKTITDYIDA